MLRVRCRLCGLGVGSLDPRESGAGEDVESEVAAALGPLAEVSPVRELSGLLKDHAVAVVYTLHDTVHVTQLVHRP